MSCVIISGNEDNYSLTCNKRSPKGNGGMTSWHKLTAPHRFYQESITWILQLPCIFVTAFSQTSIFLAWIYCELGLPTRAHRPIKISAWLISNFLVNISKEKQQRDARLLAIVRVRIRVNKGVPSSRLDKSKRLINESVTRCDTRC